MRWRASRMSAFYYNYWYLIEFGRGQRYWGNPLFFFSVHSPSHPGLKARRSVCRPQARGYGGFRDDEKAREHSMGHGWHGTGLRAAAASQHLQGRTFPLSTRHHMHGVDAGHFLVMLFSPTGKVPKTTQSSFRGTLLAVWIWMFNGV